MTGFSFSGAWYIESDYANRMADLIAPRLRAGQDAIPALLMAANNSNGRASSAENSRQKQVAVLRIDGAMSRNGAMCAMGNAQVAAMLAMCDQHEEIDAIVLAINSPGGTVDSTRMLADQVRAMKKPIVAWTPYAASAAYFVASQCDEIIVEDQLVGGVGSIGVLMVLTNEADSLEKQGLKVQIVRADGSEQKALVNGIEPVAEETMQELKAMLNACRTEFVGYVRRGRAGKLTGNEVFSGKMYVAKEAVRLGLADSTGTLEQAIEIAKKLTQKTI